MKEKLSVIIGRFQTPHLHRGHIELIEEAEKFSKNILILIGCTAATGSDKNPMDFETREGMFYENGRFVVKPLFDNPSDKDWSDSVDKIIADLGFEVATIFGGRDNSIEGYYSGKHKIKIIEQKGAHSSTLLRKGVAKWPIQSSDFRSGIIYHTENRYPIVYSTVDIAVWRHVEPIPAKAEILMGKKGDKFNFIGGFIDPNDVDLRAAACRELKEEAGFETSYLMYEFSYKVEDARYKNTKDSIMTHLFSTCKFDMLPDQSKISDEEFKEFAWIPASESSLDLISEAHRPLFLKFINSKN